MNKTRLLWSILVEA